MKTIKMNRFNLILFLGIVISISLSGQSGPVKYDLSTLFENNKLEIFNRKVVTFSENEKKGIRVSKNENDGIAWLKDIGFSNGTIELDIRGKDEFQQSFVGIAFHGVDNTTLDAIYFRPFNFQSTDPVRKVHAVQYVSQPNKPWQVLREQFPGIYEKGVNPTIGGNEWFHAKIVIKYPVVTVYLNDSKEPSLTVEKLDMRTNGKIGIWVGNNSGGDFANLQITPHN
jgi:hypothetical protein